MAGCDEGGSAGSPSARSFTLRLRNDRPPQTAGSSSLDAMERAFLPEHGAGYLADAYFQSVQELAGRHQIDAEVLLGFVIAHELDTFCSARVTHQTVSCGRDGTEVS